VAKYRGATPITLKVIGAHLLKLKPILTPLEKKCKEIPVPGGGCASKTW